jgi:hypothetical protein
MQSMFDFTPGSGQAVIELHLVPPREAGPLTHNIMFHKNSFLLQGSKMIKLLKVPIFVCLCVGGGGGL